MGEDNKNLDFLHKVAKRISVRSEKGAPILPEEVFDLFKEIFDSMTAVRIIETPVFLPFIIEKEDDFFIARCHPYRMCKGIGRTEEQAIEKLKEDIDLYNKICIDTEKKTQMEEMVKRLFPKDTF